MLNEHSTSSHGPTQIAIPQYVCTYILIHVDWLVVNSVMQL